MLDSRSDDASFVPFAVTGEFCEVDGPIPVVFFPEGYANSTLRALAKRSGDDGPVESSDMKAAVDAAISGLVIRALTGETSCPAAATRLDLPNAEKARRRNTAYITMNGVPWVGHPSLPHGPALHEATGCPAQVAVTAVVIAISDALARGFTRTLCIAYVSLVPLGGTAALHVRKALQTVAEAVAVHAERVHPHELVALHCRLAHIRQHVEDPDGGEDGGGPSDVSVDDDEVLQHFWSLAPHKRRRCFEEHTAVAARLAAYGTAASDPEEANMATPAMLQRLVGKGTLKLRPLADVAIDLKPSHLSGIDPGAVSTTDATQAGWQDWFAHHRTTVVEPLCYAALCRLPCVVIFLSPSDRPSMEWDAIPTLAILRATLAVLFDTGPTDYVEPEAPSLGDISDANGVLAWHISAKEAAHGIPALPMTAVQVVCVAESPVEDDDGMERENFALSTILPDGWMPAEGRTNFKQEETRELPDNSVIRSTLQIAFQSHGHHDANGSYGVRLRRAMTHLREYISARLAYCEAHVPDLLPRTMKRGPGGYAWEPLVRPPDDSGWIVNCLRAEALARGWTPPRRTENGRWEAGTSFVFAPRR